MFLLEGVVFSLFLILLLRNQRLQVNVWGKLFKWGEIRHLQYITAITETVKLNVCVLLDLLFYIY